MYSQVVLGGVREGSKGVVQKGAFRTDGEEQSGAKSITMTLCIRYHGMLLSTVVDLHA